MKRFVRAGTVVDGGAAIQGRRRRRRKLGRGPALMAAAALTSLGWSVAAGVAAGAASQSSGGVFVARPTYSHLAFRGTVNVRDLARTLTPAVARRESADDGRAPLPLLRGGAVSSPAVPTPDPAVTAVSATKGGASGFVGITDSTQRLADNGNGYNTEPPDQGLCASGGLIVETVNHGVQVYTETKAVHVNRIGSAPEDGFTCYAAYGGNGQCRWGDYSAASSDGAGNIVMATEMIPDSPCNTVANWGTYISRLNP